MLNPPIFQFRAPFPVRCQTLRLLPRPAFSQPAAPPGNVFRRPHCFCPESRFRTSRPLLTMTLVAVDELGFRPPDPAFCIFFLRKMRDNDFFVYICSPETQIFRGPSLERCRSGRSGRTRNAVYGQLYRGFESLSLRQSTMKRKAISCKRLVYRKFYF